MDRTTPILLRLRVLGGFELRADSGRDAAPAGRKTRGLMACLALSPGDQWPREKLRALLWSERSEEQASASLRQALAELRRALGEPSPLRTENDSVSLDSALLTVDALDFDRLAKSGDLAAAAALYRGDLLEGHGVRDTAFDDWLLAERRHLHDLAVDVLSRLAVSRAGDLAIETALRLLRIEPEREVTHRLLMRLYAAADRRPLALRQYELCRETLQRELSIAPDAETEGLYQQIQDLAVLPPTVAQSTAFPKSKPSIAVLPFTNMSGDAEQEYFSDGITEDIITDLSKVSGLFVLSRNFAFGYERKAAALEMIAKELGVDYLVEGSVRKAGQRVRISAQLIEGATGVHLWAARYDRDLTDIFAVQDEITETIVEHLKVKLLPDEKESIQHTATEDIEAYTHLLRGRQLFRSRTKSALIVARRMFARAVELDPRYARAYAGLADCGARLKSSYGVDISVDDVLATTATALAIDPNLAEAHAARGHALMVGDRRAEAASAFERALALDPDCYEAHDYFAQFCLTAGDFGRAAKHYMRALEIQPDDYSSPIYLVNIFRSLGRSEDLVKYAHLGVRRAEEALRLHPEDSKPAQLGAVALVVLGEHDRAKNWLARALAIDPDDNIVQYNAACTYSLLGETDRAIDLLETVLPQVGSDWRLWFMNDSDLDPIRDHPRYQKLLELKG